MAARAKIAQIFSEFDAAVQPDVWHIMLPEPKNKENLQLLVIARTTSLVAVQALDFV